MCCIIKVSQKLLDKNKFACSKIILWIHYSWMYNGKPTFSKYIMPTTNHPTHSTPTLRSKMFSDLFYEENPCRLILARGISKKQPHYPIILVVFLREI